MRRITATEAETWVNLPELQRFQRGPIAHIGAVDWVSLAHHENAVILEHDGCVGLLHPAPFDGVWFCHHAIPRARWGERAFIATRAMLLHFFDGFTIDPPVRRVVGWTMKSNRLSVRFGLRLGFVIDGEMPFDGDAIVMLGVTRCQAAAAERSL